MKHLKKFTEQEVPSGEPEKKPVHAAKQFTFKKHSPTGRYRSFFATHIDINIQTKSVGTIHELRGTIGHDYGENHGKWEIRLKLKEKRLQENQHHLSGSHSNKNSIQMCSLNNG